MACGTSGGNTTVYRTFQKQTHCHTCICLILCFPALPPPPLPLTLHRALLPSSQGEQNLIPGRTDFQCLNAPRTPHIVPIPIHEGHGNELERPKHRESSLISVVVPLRLRRGAPLCHHHSILASIQPSFLLSPSQRRFAPV